MSVGRAVPFLTVISPVARILSYKGIHFGGRRFAGHSHWQNVKHTKDANDKLKSKASSYYYRAVQIAVKVLAEAKANSVPSSTLQRALKAENTTDPYLVEVQAQGGLFILIESCAYPITPERQHLASVVKKYGCSVSPAIGRISKEFFEHVGLVSVAGGSDCLIKDIDTATNIGIEIGASDVDECVANGQKIFRFYCSPTEFEKLRRRLQDEHGISALSADDTYLPKSLVSVQPGVWASLNEMYSRIREQHDSVDRIFDNVDVKNDS
ncbi:Coiled-coil domain-containing protein 44 [Fasciola hepatica]|uniref:Coiled-coil domain-containing protein 44 n=1 Tax=Fasciola hepatica TaxID=6192 RepID=A0A4E0RRC8_FASHE|nr:Coiled-coil domain-containing protein 44 [Fasciola hepatica]